MSLKERLLEDMKEAMKAREAGKQRVSVIRLARAAIQNAEIAKGGPLSDDDVAAVLAREIKERREAIIEFEKLDRSDQIERLNEEIAILAEYLPKQLTEEEIRQLVQETIQQVGAAGAADMGKVMGPLMGKVRGRADGRLVNQIVREMLQ
ncbi:MAG: GatB/YqeY domain-containing protein [Bacillota bacterium]